MNPVHEHCLRKWIARIISSEGYDLRKTGQADPAHKELGRWSRWKGRSLVETHVDLVNLALRCKAYREARKARRVPLREGIRFEISDYPRINFYVSPTEQPKPVQIKITDPQGSLF